MNLNKPCMRLTAKFLDKQDQFYYQYDISLVAEDCIAPCIEDLKTFVNQIWPYLQDEKSVEEFLEKRTSNEKK